MLAAVAVVILFAALVGPLVWLGASRNQPPRRPRH